MSRKPHVVFDVETYSNYFGVGFKLVGAEQYWLYEMTESTAPDMSELARLMYACCLVGFNSSHYDLHMLAALFHGQNLAQLKHTSDKIINFEGTFLDCEKDLGIPALTNLDHVDLIELTRGKPSLKKLAARMHVPKMQELPHPPDAILTPAQINEVRRYNRNDLRVTETLYTKIKDEVDLRADMGEKYKMDLRSKSRAQIAETVLVSEICKITGKRPVRPKFNPQRILKYNAPSYLRYESHALNDLLQRVVAADFQMSDKAKVLTPVGLQDELVEIGGKVYKFGIGGVHSVESEATHVSDENFQIIDRDVDSYYPAVIINLGVYPKQCGLAFLDVFRDVVNTRILSKRDSKKYEKLLATDPDNESYKTALKSASITNATLKIVVNSSYGKFGSQYSVLFAPDLMIAVTLSGQLSLIMLIERLELAGIPVISANTDGVTSKVPTEKIDEFNAILAQWESDTGLTTEEARYSALYSRDVNHYFAVKTDGKVKGKGIFGPMDLEHDPDCRIVADAVIAFLTVGTPLSDTIYQCTDIRKFIKVSYSKSGCFQNGEKIGKIVRYYYGAEVKEYLTKGNGDKLPSSEGAKVIMDLPRHFPDDIDYDKYVSLAKKRLFEIGAIPRGLF